MMSTGVCESSVPNTGAGVCITEGGWRLQHIPVFKLLWRRHEVSVKAIRPVIISPRRSDARRSCARSSLRRSSTATCSDRSARRSSRRARDTSRVRGTTQSIHAKHVWNMYVTSWFHVESLIIVEQSHVHKCVRDYSSFHVYIYICLCTLFRFCIFLNT